MIGHTQGDHTVAKHQTLILYIYIIINSRVISNKYLCVYHWLVVQTKGKTIQRHDLNRHRN